MAKTTINKRHYISRKNRGMTLIELTVVLLILVGLAGMVVPYITNTSNRASCTATGASMVAIRNAIVGSFENPGYFQDMNAMPDHLADLFQKPDEESEYNPVTQKGWRGPYLHGANAGFEGTGTNFIDDINYVNSKVLDTDPVIYDGYITKQNPIVIQIPDSTQCQLIDVDYDIEECVRLVSAGDDGELDTALSDADGSGRDDDRLHYLLIPDPNSSTECAEL